MTDTPRRTLEDRLAELNLYSRVGRQVTAEPITSSPRASLQDAEGLTGKDSLPDDRNDNRSA